MAERFIFTWKDEQEEAMVKAFAKDNGMSIADAMHHLISQIPVVGKVNWDTGKVTEDEGEKWVREFQEKVDASIKRHPTLILADGERVPVTPEELAARE